jgi:DNA-binding LytR/AlgR family response regulator
MDSQISIHQTLAFPISSTKSPLVRLSRDYPPFNTSEAPSRKAAKASSSIIVEDGKLRLRVAVENILYAKAEHVYVGIYFSNEQRVIQRGSLAGLFVQLPANQFIQVHRSYIVNLRWVESWTKDTISIGGQEIPISRSRRQEVLAILSTNKKTEGIR